MRNFESLLVREKGAHLTSALKALLPDENVKVMHADFTIKSVSGDEQIVYGEVYAPYVLDSHGEMMLPLAIKQLAHRFLIAQKITSSTYSTTTRPSKPLWSKATSPRRMTRSMPRALGCWPSRYLTMRSGRT